MRRLSAQRIEQIADLAAAFLMGTALFAAAPMVIPFLHEALWLSPLAAVAGFAVTYLGLRRIERDYQPPVPVVTEFAMFDDTPRQTDVGGTQDADPLVLTQRFHSAPPSALTEVTDAPPVMTRVERMFGSPQQIDPRALIERIEAHFGESGDEPTARASAPVAKGIGQDVRHDGDEMHAAIEQLRHSLG